MHGLDVLVAKAVRRKTLDAVRALKDLRKKIMPKFSQTDRCKNMYMHVKN
jgi:hypothetical protein